MAEEGVEEEGVAEEGEVEPVMEGAVVIIMLLFLYLQDPS